MESPVDPRRVRTVQEGIPGSGPVVCWMSRDQRSRDNWALLHAQALALRRGRPLVVAFALAPSFMGATIRQYAFMLRGLAEVDRELSGLGIALHLLRGVPSSTVPRLIRRVDATALVCDFDPLRIKRGWLAGVSARARVPVMEVDAHNVVPCQAASQKQEWGAYTLRPKLLRVLPGLLTEVPPLREHPRTRSSLEVDNDWEGAVRRLRVDRSVAELGGPAPGEGAARTALRAFVEERLDTYADARNDPNLDGQSGLSPYLHFGALSAQRVALEVRAHQGDVRSTDAFMEQLIVRRELADNFCLYNARYDSFEGFPEWARRTLDDHRADRRPHLYSRAELEQGRTDDAAWNAAQLEMVRTGAMHGYMRMYWAKRLLEWTSSPEEALAVAISLNDRYELDGRDPNGYAGIAWSIGGVHDRAWGARPVFGKVRCMSARGLRSKFDVDAYVRRHLGGRG